MISTKQPHKCIPNKNVLLLDVALNWIYFNEQTPCLVLLEKYWFQGLEQAVAARSDALVWTSLMLSTMWPFSALNTWTSQCVAMATVRPSRDSAMSARSSGAIMTSPVISSCASCFFSYSTEARYRTIWHGSGKHEVYAMVREQWQATHVPLTFWLCRTLIWYKQRIIAILNRHKTV